MCADREAKRNIRMNNVLPGFTIDTRPVNEAVRATIPAALRPGRRDRQSGGILTVRRDAAPYLAGRTLRVCRRWGSPDPL